MVFSSLSFLFFFLPVVFVSYYVINSRVYRNTVLLVFSLLFYSWGEPKYVLIMLLAGLVAYVGGLLIERYRQRPKAARAAMTVTVCLLLANLFCFKYLNFAAESLAALLGRKSTLGDIALPIGISFYTFQILSYVIDLYWGRIALQKNPFYLLLYVSFFPQLIAGPIVRYATIEEEISNRRESPEDVAEGLKRFILGLAKKVIIANNVAAVAEIIYAGDPAIYGTAMYWLAALAYTLQIYFDFSGYSDMAIGLGRMFGFHFLENFDHPYMALSLTDFWRRWHISLSSWFRDYVYIPLGGNRVGRGRWLLNIMIVWGLTGLWHGADWNFLLWGLFNGGVLLAEKLWLLKAEGKLPKLVRGALTFLLVNIGWVIFNQTDFVKMWSALKMMFFPRGTAWLDMIAADGDITRAILYVPLGLICMFPLLGKVRPAASHWQELVRCGLWLLLLLVCVMFTISSSYNPFIYFRF